MMRWSFNNDWNGSLHHDMIFSLLFRYFISFLLDSTVGLVVIYIGLRICQCVVKYRKQDSLMFGEYGKYREHRAYHSWQLVFRNPADFTLISPVKSTQNLIKASVSAKTLQFNECRVGAMTKDFKIMSFCVMIKYRSFVFRKTKQDSIMFGEYGKCEMRPYKSSLTCWAFVIMKWVLLYSIVVCTNIKGKVTCLL